MKIQRTGMTEGCLIFNDWKGRIYKNTEDNFINWLYSSAGWYDKDIKGSYFDIDVEAVKKSDTYNRFLSQYRQSLYDTEHTEILYHKDYFPDSIDTFRSLFPFKERLNSYWSIPESIKSFITPKTLLINPMASLIAKEYPQYNFISFDFPYTFFNDGPDRNSFETLDLVFSKIPSDFDTALVSIGPYGCLMVDRIWKTGKTAITVGSGLHTAFPLKEIPPEFIPRDYEKIEEGRYWKQ